MNFTETARQLAGQAGLLLGWRPDDYWRATPDELATALAAFVPPGGGDALDRAALDRLKEMFPDG